MTPIEDKFKLPRRYEISRPNVWLEMYSSFEKYNPIDLGLGFPDFLPPQHITDCLEQVAKTDIASTHQYSKIFGHPRLVNILRKLYSKLINREISANEMLISAGAQLILHNTFNAFLNEGDEVIVIEPYFVVYAGIIKETGAVLRYIPLRPKSNGVKSTADFYLDKDELEALFNEKTKAIVFNTPNNPLGKVYNLEEMEIIANLCKKWNVLCIADEVYEWMVYKPNKHIRMATLPGMWERTVTVGSAGKTFSVTGWRTGWAYGPEVLIKNLWAVHVICVNTHSTPIQEAHAMAFEKEYDDMLNKPKECYFFSLSEELQGKKEILLKAFTDAGINTIEPQGGYMLIADVESLAKQVDLSQESDKSVGFRMAKWLMKQGVMSIPVSTFYSEGHSHLGENYLRFCFIKKDEKLQQAAEALQKIKITNLNVDYIDKM